MTITPKIPRCARPCTLRPSGVTRRCLCSATPRTVRRDKSQDVFWWFFHVVMLYAVSCFFILYTFNFDQFWGSMDSMVPLAGASSIRKMGRRWQHRSDAFWQTTNSRIGWNSNFRCREVVKLRFPKSWGYPQLSSKHGRPWLSTEQPWWPCGSSMTEGNQMLIPFGWVGFNFVLST